MIDFIHASLNSFVFYGNRCHAWKFRSFCLLKAGVALLSLLAAVTTQASLTYAQSLRSEASENSADVSAIDLNLRIVWGGPKPASYVGTIELDTGMLTATQQLGIDQNDPSFMLKDSTGRLVIEDRETRFGGCDIRVQAKSNSRLKVQLQATDPDTSQSTTKEYSWTLKQLRDNPDLQPLGLENCRLSIDRVPGDRLRVVTPRSHLIYNSEEPLSIQIQPYGLPWNSISANLECTLVRSDEEHPVFKKSKVIHVDARGHGEPFDVFATAPKEEGVYELRFKLEPKRILPGLLIRHLSIERVVQLVVFNSVTSPRMASTPNAKEEDSSSRWRIQNQLPLKSFESQTLTATLMSRVENSRRFPFFEFAKSLSIVPKETHNDFSSESTEDRLNLVPGSIATASITGLVPGRLHRLTLLTASHRDTYRVCLSTVGSKDSKSPAELILQETFDAPPKGAIEEITGNAKKMDGERMEVLFWPTTRSAKLEVTNLNATQSLGITGVNVDVWQEATDPYFTGVQPGAPTGSVLEIHSTNIRSAFGSNATNSTADSPQVYDDWRVFLKFANQIALYCNANGFECLSLNVHSQGGTLFPCSRLSSNARFDTGTFSSDGRDPLRKDVVELLYRVTSRYGIQFVPLLELDSPIREIEEALTKTDNRDLLQRREESQTDPSKGDNPYNPLAPRVQQAIAVALDEFENRYRSHSQYHGYALRASSSSHLEISLPIDQTNKSILDQFAGSVGGNLPKDLSQRELFVSQKLQSVYSQWIKESVATYLSKLRAKPKWVSVEAGRVTNQSQNSPKQISPIAIGSPPNLDFRQAIGIAVSQWHFGEPGPIHVALEKPLNRFDTEFSRLSNIANLTDVQHVRSLPYRDSTRSISKVRVWTSREFGRSLLVANSGAVSETIHVCWDEFPARYAVNSTQDSHASGRSTIEIDQASKEWRMQIAAGEALRIDCEGDYFSPISWYSQEADAIRSIDLALQSLEQAITRLSTPQARNATLTNSSFELHSSSPRRGRLAGWTTSIDPNTNVDIDSNSAGDGRASIKLETSSASSIAWLQSDPFALPPSDRLYVTFQSLTEQVPQNLSLTLLRFDANSERFESIAVRELADRIPRPNETKWGTIGFDFSKELQSKSKVEEPALYRLQFEARGIGRIWLDAVSLSTSFLRETERRDLRSELFLARTSLQNGDSGPAVVMLNSPRGRLVQWGDAFVTKPNVLVSIRNGNAETSNAVTPITDPRPKAEPLNDPKSTDTKRRPIQRLRNSWWPRKD